MRFVPEAVVRTVARNALHLQKASPELLLGAGIVGMVGSTVLACRATLKVHEVLDETKKNLELTKKAREEHSEEYSENDRGKDVTLIYFQSAVKFARLYAPAIVVGAASIYCLRSSHNILTQRNVALTAAYTALDKGFKEYRARVVNKYGEEEDYNLRHGREVVTVTDEETGKKKKTAKLPSSTEPSIYAKFFDESCSPWEPDPEINMIYLRCQQNYLNDMLRSRGHVFLNEVYDRLGIERTQAGSVVGWILSKDGSTDNYIDFGIFDYPDDSGNIPNVTRAFVNGLEGSILLDFNVDGIIYDKLER